MSDEPRNPAGQSLRDLYRRRARRYDLAIRLYRLAGFDIPRYRRLTVAALALRRGDVVVDLGCGTGLNFPLLEDAVGSGGVIIGVDLTDAMLERARARVSEHGWRNVELVQGDIGTYTVPRGVAAVLSTFAITLVPDYDRAIHGAAEALRVGGRLAVLDLKQPERWPAWLVRLAVRLNRPYGVTLALAERHPWESVRRWLREVEFHELYLGAAYLSVGERAGDQRGRRVSGNPASSQATMPPARLDTLV